MKFEGSYETIELIFDQFSHALKSSSSSNEIKQLIKEFFEEMFKTFRIRCGENSPNF